jgi:hypothetical protein
MKKEDLPQDNGALNKLTRELCYVVDKDGRYTTELSTGWEVKAKALDATWNDIDEKIEDIRARVLKGEFSPVRYYMEVRLMDLEILSAYTGFWKWTIKRHMRPDVFKNLSDKKLQKYASAFNVSVEELKEMKQK